MRVDVKPDMLRWAVNRAGLSSDALYKKFSKFTEWEQGKIKPTFKQLEAFAKAVRVPVGYMFLSDPPEESIPIPD